MNTFGNIYKLTSFGESHGTGIGGVIDGMPAGIVADLDFLQCEMARRRPGQSSLTTQRAEPDEVELLSGIFEGKTTGTPIGFLVRNTSQQSADYDNMRRLYRPSHADFTYQAKYGIRDHRGGGRSSARETITRVVGGAFAKMALRELGITVQAYTAQVGDIRLDKDYTAYNLALAEYNSVRCPDTVKAQEMANLIDAVRLEGDTIGGVVCCVVKGCPAGLGEPVAGKLQAQLAAAMLSINAAKGFEYGLGFAGASGKGSEQNDIFVPNLQAPYYPPMGDGVTPPSRGLPPAGGLRGASTADHITTLTNRSGGIQGGISNGQDIYFRVAFKPVATLLRNQQTVDVDGNAVEFKAKGRHDPCVLPRAVPVVEAMAAMVILDNYLLSKTTKL